MEIQPRQSTDLVRVDQGVETAVKPERGASSGMVRLREVLEPIGYMVVDVVAGGSRRLVLAAAVTLGVIVVNGTTYAQVADPMDPATVTITARPASVNEGAGTVDVQVVATIEAGDTPESNLTITLSDVDSGAAADLDLLGYFSNEGQQDGSMVTDLAAMPPVLTIPGTARQSNELFLRFSVPLGDANEDEETITLAATLSDTTNFTSSGLGITIPTTQPAAGETRIAQKAVLLSVESGTTMGWDTQGDLPGRLSSRDFVIDSQTYSLTSIDGRTDDSRLQINVSGQFPDDQNKLLRIITRTDSGDLRISDANFAGASGTAYVYRWTSNLPEIIEEEYFTMELVHAEPVDADTNFGTAEVADQQWHRDRAIAPVVLPAVDTGDTPVTYTLTPELPAGVAKYDDAAAVDADSNVTYDGAAGFPVLLGTPIAEFATATFTWTATDRTQPDDGSTDTDSITFTIGVATPAPSNLRLTTGQLSFLLEWDEPTPASGSGVTITGYRIDKLTSDNSADIGDSPLVENTNSTDTTHLDAAFSRSDPNDNIRATYRILAISAGGTSLPSSEVTSPVVSMPPVPRVTATATGAQSVELIWFAPPLKDATIDGYAIQRTTVAPSGDRTVANAWTSVSADTDSTDLSFTDDSSALAAATTYYYQVAVVSDSDAWPWSGDATVTTPADTALPVTLTTQPNSFTEGAGIVDVFLTAGVDAAASGAIGITLVTPAEDVTFVGGAPTITIRDGQTNSGRVLVQIMVPVDTDSAEEMVRIVATTTNTAYTVSPLVLTIAADPLPADEIRFVEKQLILTDDGNYGWDNRGTYNPPHEISSETLPTELREGAGENEFREVILIGGSSPLRLDIEFRHPLPGRLVHDLLVRFNVDGTETDLSFGDAATSRIAGDRHQYSWSSGLPSLPAEAWFRMSIIHDVPPVPAAVADLTAAAGGPQTVTLSWTAPADNGGRITHYEVRRTTNASPAGDSDWTPLADSADDSASYTDASNDVLPNTTYYYQVAAVNSGGTGAWSNTSGPVTTQAATVPPAPTALMLVVGDGQITLSWTAPELTGGSAITGYVVQSSDSASGSFTNVDGNDPTTDAATTTYTHAGLPNGTAVFYQVLAKNSVGNSATGATGSATPVDPRVNTWFYLGTGPEETSRTFTVMEGADTSGTRINFNRASNPTVTYFPIRQEFLGGATAADFADIASDGNIFESVLSGTLNYPAEEGIYWVRVSGLNYAFDVASATDDNWDPGEGVRYTLATSHSTWPANFRVDPDRNSFTLNVTDDEDPPTVTLRVSPTELTETGATNTATVTAMLDFSDDKGFLQSAHTLTLSFTDATFDTTPIATYSAADGEGDYNADGTTITLPVGNTQPTDEVTLTVVDDSGTADGEDLESIVLRGAVSLDGTAVEAVTVAGVEATIAADPEPEVATDFGSATIPNQQWHRDQAIAPVVLPAVDTGNTPVTYTLTPDLPDGVAKYDDAAAVDADSNVTYDGAAGFPVLLGTPTAEFAAATFTWTATDSTQPDDGSTDTDSVTFTVGVAPTAPSGLTVTPRLRAFTLEWTAPAVDNASGVIVSGYTVQRSADSGTSWPETFTVSGADTTTYTDSSFVEADDGNTFTYRVVANSTGGDSLPSTTASDTVLNIAVGLTASEYTIVEGTPGGEVDVAITFSREITFDEGNSTYVEVRLELISATGVSNADFSTDDWANVDEPYSGFPPNFTFSPIVGNPARDFTFPIAVLTDEMMESGEQLRITVLPSSVNSNTRFNGSGALAAGTHTTAVITLADPRPVYFFATQSNTVTVTEGETTGGSGGNLSGLSLNVTGGVGSNAVEFPVRRTFVGGAVAGDFTAFAAGGDELFDHVDDDVFLIRVSGTSQDFGIGTMQDEHWDPGEGVTYTLLPNHDDWPDGFRVRTVSDANGRDVDDTVTVMVTDDETAPTVTLSVSPNLLTETGTTSTATVTAMLDVSGTKGFFQSAHTLTLSFTDASRFRAPNIAAHNATVGMGDYNSSATTIELPAGGQPTASVTLTVVDDSATANSEPLEVIVLRGAVTNGAGDAVSDVTVAGTEAIIAGDSMPFAGETLITVKSIGLFGDGDPNWGWDYIGSYGGTISSREFQIDDRPYEFRHVFFDPTSPPRYEMGFDRQLPAGLVLRTTVGGVTTDLAFSDADRSGSTYRWVDADSIPTIPDDTRFTVALFEVPATIPTLPVTLTAEPAIVTEGEGIVDVVITASVAAAVEGTNLGIVVDDAGTGRAMLSDDYTVAGSSLPATITIRAGQTSARAVVRLEVPVTNDGEPEMPETIMLNGTSTGNDQYLNPADLSITIATDEVAAGETRYVEKQLILDEVNSVLGWHRNGTSYPGAFLSSRPFWDGATSNNLQSITATTTEIIVRVDHALHDSRVDNVLLRFTEGGTVQHLWFRDAASANDGSGGVVHRYTWSTAENTGLTLPALAADTQMTMEIIHLAPIRLDFERAEYGPVTEGGTAVITIDFGRAVAVADGDASFVVLVSGASGASGADFGTPTDGTAALDAAADTTNGWVIPVAVGDTSADVSVPITGTDTLWEFGEQLRLSFEARAGEWVSAFAVRTTGSANRTATVNIGESRQAPTVELTSTQNSLTERGGYTMTTFSYGITPADMNPGALPTDYTIALTGFAGSATRNRGNNAATGDYSISTGGNVVPGFIPEVTMAPGAPAVPAVDVELAVVDTGNRPTATLSVRDDGTDESAGENITFTAEVRTAAGTVVPDITIATEAITIVDALTVSWVNAADTAEEGDGPTVHPVVATLNAVPAEQVQISIALGTSTATDPEDFATPTLTDFIMFAANASGDDLRQSGNLSLVGDLVVEAAETIVLTMSAGTNFPAGADLDTREYTLTINDNDSLEISLEEPSRAWALEGSVLTFSVSIDNPLAVALEVDWNITPTDDVSPTSGTVTLPANSAAGTRVATEAITVTDDGVTTETGESFMITLMNPTGVNDADSGLGTRAALGSNSSRTVSIVDDAAPVVLSFDAAMYSETEGNTADVTIDLSRALTADEVAAGAAFVLVVVPAGGAIGPGATGQDYTHAGLDTEAVTANGFVVTPAAGTMTHVVQIAVVADSESETGEMVELSFATGDAAWADRAFTTAGSTQATATLNLGDNPNLPDAPTGVTATVPDAANPQSIMVSWTAPAGTITGYAVQRSNVAAVPPRTEASWATIAENTGDDVASYTDAGNHLRAGTTYAYRVAAINAEGRGSWSTDVSMDLMITVVKPSAPAAAPTLEPGYTQITVSWVAPGLDGGQAITGYRLQESSDGTMWMDLETVTGVDTTSYNHTGLADDATVYYRAAALNGVTAGDDNFSAASARASPTDRTEVNFATASVTQSADEGAMAVTITVEASADVGTTAHTLMASPLLLSRSFPTDGNNTATASDISTSPTLVAHTTDPNNEPYSLALTGTSATFTVTAESDEFWDPGESVTFTLAAAHADWPPALRVGDRATATVTLGDQDAAPTITVAVSTIALAEAGGANTTTVTATIDATGNKGFFQTEHTLALDFAGTGFTETAVAIYGTDTSSGDFYSGVSGASTTTIALPAGDIQPGAGATLTVRDDDADNEPLKTIVISGGVRNSAGTEVIPAADITFPTIRPTIVDVLTAAISFGTTTTVAEPADPDTASVTYTVSLTATPIVAFPLTVIVRGDVATTDYSPPSLPMPSFAANTATLTQTGTIAILDDDVAEGDETLTLTLRNDNPPSGAAVDATAASIAVTDGEDDTVSVLIRRVPGQAERVAEGQTFEFELALLGPVGVDVTVAWSVTTDATDITADDFVGMTTGTVTFPANGDAASRTASHTLNIADTADDEGDQPFTVTLGAITSALGTRATVAEAPGNAITGTIFEPDRVRPTLTRFEVPARVNDVGTFTVTFEFNEDVQASEFTIADIVVTKIVTGGDNVPAQMVGTPVADALSPNRLFTAEITPAATWMNDDTITVTVSGVPDLAGNNLAEVSRTFTFDTAGPTPTLAVAAPDSSPVNGDFTLTIDFGEAVNGFAADDVTVMTDAGTASAGTSFLTGSDGDQTYTIAVTVPAEDATLTIGVAATVATDLAGNDNLDATDLSVTVDRTAPTATFMNNPSDVITGPFTLTINFSEKVEDFTADDADITVMNGSKGTLTETSTGTDPSVFTLEITPAADGPLTVNVLENAATDLAGNGNDAPTPFSATVTLAQPTATVTTDAGNTVDGVTYINAATFDITVTFSADVSNFDDEAMDITVTNGTVSTGSLTGSGTTYTATITPTLDYEGEVVVTVPAGAANAIAPPGAGNSEGELRVTIDTTAPTGSITPAGDATHVNADFEITIAFEEPVVDFDATDIDVSSLAGIGVTGFTAGAPAGQMYTATVTVPANTNGALTITIAATGLTDRAGQNPAAAITASVTVDTIAPTGPTLDPADGSRVNGNFDLTLDFGEAVTGLADENVGMRVTGSDGVTAGSLDSTDVANGRYTVTMNVPITVPGGATVTVTVAAGAVTDLAGNPSGDALIATYTMDRTAPTPAFTPTTPGRVSGDIELTIAFGEAVTEFDATDVVVTGHADAALDDTTFAATANPGEYQVTVEVPTTVPEDTVITVELAAGAAEDLAGNDSMAGSATYTVDRTAPTVSTVVLAGGVTAPVTAPFDVTVTFSEDVTGVTEASFTVDKGTITAVTEATGPDVYTVSIDPTANGNLTLELNAGVMDLAGNASVASTDLFSVQAVVSELTVEITGAANVAATFPVTFTFGRAIVRSSFTAGDLTLSAGATAAEPTTTDDTVFTVQVTATAEGTVTVELAAGSVNDADNVGNQVAVPFTTNADPTPPAITFRLTDGTELTDGTAVNADFTLRIDFDDNIGTTFDITDVTVSSDGDAENRLVHDSMTGESYTIDIDLPTADGNFTITIAAGAVENAVGLENVVAELTLNADRVAPAVRFADLPRNSATNAESFGFTIHIDHGPATAFTRDNLSLTGIAGVNNTNIALTEVVAGTEYDATVTLPTAAAQPDLEGRLTIAVAAGQIMDAAGNANAGTSRVVWADRVAPMIESMTRTGTGAITGIFTLTVTFSEEMDGFDLDDFTIPNGSVTTLRQTSADGEPSVFTVIVTPTGATPLTVDIAADRVTDLAGNGNVATTTPTGGPPAAVTTFSAPVALTVPIATVTAGTDVGNVVSGVTYINTDTFEVTVSFTEKVTGFDAVGDVAVTGGTAGAPTSVTAPDEDVNRVFTVVITPTADGEVTVQVPANAATATGGTQQANPASSPVEFTVDRAAPVVASITPGSTRVNGTFPVTITFNEPVTGFDMADLSVMNGTAAALVAQAPTFNRIGASPAAYNAEFTTMITPTAGFVGNVTISVAADVAQDRATNNNTALATPVTVAADLEAPTVEGITAAVAATATVAGPFEVMVTFSEPVNEFTRADLELGNATAGEPVAASNRESFTVTITPAADGAVEVQVQAEAVVDDFGNRGPAALSPATAFSRTAALPTAPGKPTDLRASGGRNTINLRWNAPTDDGGSAITGYRIQTSPDGSTDWANVVAHTMSTRTTYAHADLLDDETRHYRIYAINVAGESGESDTASATTFAPIPITETPMARMMVDTNDDGRITSVDASALLFQVTGEGDADADPEVRRTLFGPLLPANVDRDNTGAVDAAIDKVVAEIEATLMANEEALDINGDGETDENDAEIIHNVTAFPELVGDGQPGTGFQTFRQELIGRFMAGGNPSDAEMRAVIRAVRGL